MTKSVLYESPRGLYPFQAEGVGRTYYTPDALAVWDTGLGKTHLAMATGALLFEDDMLDQVIVIAETNKIVDWVEDFGRFTKLSVDLYHGTVKKRTKLREAPPQVLVSTFETVRNDAGSPNKALKNPKLGNWLPGPLVTDWQGRRVLVVYDEFSRLRERGSGIYKAQECLVGGLRAVQRDGTRTMGLTATPIERNPENAFNLGRLLVPHRMGSVADFERDHVVAKDFFGNPVKFKNLGPDDPHRDPGVPTLREKWGKALLRKSKFDPDVINEFPKQVEEIEVVRLDQRHAEFYAVVRRAISEQNLSKMEERALFGTLRQIAGYPLALTRSNGKLAQAIVSQVGAEGLKALGSAKADYLIQRLHKIVRGQGAKAVVFTFYGQSILPLLHDDLRAAGFNVVINHGQMTPEQRQESIRALRYGNAEVFLTSDAGSRGLNLPEATYVENYEGPLTYANHRQRADRVHRIDSMADIVFTETLIAEGTVEEAIADKVLRSNEWHDIFLDDDDEYGEHLTAAERRKLIQFAKTRLKAA